MSPRRAHPTYLNAPQTNRWGKMTISSIPMHLKLCWTASRGDRKRPEWVWVVLTGGVVISYREEHGRGTIRLARQEDPTPEALGRWENEVGVFLRHWHMKIVDGETEPCTCPGTACVVLPPTERDVGKTTIRLQELRLGETRPGRAICGDCLGETGEVVEVDHYLGAPPSGQRCIRHAMDAGKSGVSEGPPV